VADELNPWSLEGWNITAQAVYFHKYGLARAEARARDAGSFFGAIHPPKPIKIVRKLGEPIPKVKPKGPLSGPPKTVGVFTDDLNDNQKRVLYFVRRRKTKAALTPPTIAPHFGMGLTMQARVDLFGLLASITASPAVGLTMAATVRRERDLAAAPTVGLTMASPVKLEKDLSVAAAVGLTMASPVKLEKDLSVAAAVGLTMASPVKLEKDLSVAAAVGLTMASPVKLQKNLSVPITLGLTMASPVKLQKNLVVADAVGLTMASPVKLEKDLSRRRLIGLTMAAVIQLQKNLTVPIGLGLTESSLPFKQLQLTFKQSANINTNASATFNFANQPIGSADPNRWVFVTWAAKNTANLTLNSLTIGGVTATQETFDGTLAPGIGVTSIAFANVPTGTTADVVFTWSGAFTGTAANGMGINVYTVLGELDTVAVDSLDDNSNASPVTKAFKVPRGGVAFVSATSNNTGSASVSGDFTADRNGVAYATNLNNFGMSVSNRNIGFTTIDTFTATNFSFVSAACPKIGRAYGLVGTRATSDGNVRVTSDGTVRRIS
jgi:hypothetical protein